jgi:hypothetical protein
VYAIPQARAQLFDSATTTIPGTLASDVLDIPLIFADCVREKGRIPAPPRPIANHHYYYYVQGRSRTLIIKAKPP